MAAKYMAILRHRAVRATWCHKRYKFAEKIARAPSCTVFQGELYGHREGLVIRNLDGEEQQQQQHNGKTTQRVSFKVINNDFLLRKAGADE